MDLPPPPSPKNTWVRGAEHHRSPVRPPRPPVSCCICGPTYPLIGPHGKSHCGACAAPAATPGALAQRKSKEGPEQHLQPPERLGPGRFRIPPMRRVPGPVLSLLSALQPSVPQGIRQHPQSPWPDVAP
ncbi:hypothetical protein NDU88_006120 [Pleurodeles waltl]|uniref:Uncharacterized protein n=1 Tax=Pleurodeles waltl TaxID=8319 RepID=A0AAV7UKN8_PLEWA|nr:hypothetical protein NDU88_006120 [Pleurodeles waltl]